MKNRSRTQNTLLNLTTGLISEFVIYFFNFITRTVFIQTLGKEFLGIGGLFTSILTMLSLTDLGIGSALNYRLYKPLKDKDESKLKAIMNFYKRAYSVIAIAILVIGLAAIPFLKFLIKDYARVEALGLSIGAIFALYLLQSVSSYAFFAYKSAIVKANQKEYLINILGYATSFVLCILEIAALKITKNYSIYLAVTIAVNICHSYITAKIAEKQFPFLKQKNTEKLSKEEIREIMRDCMFISMISINSVVLKATDNIVLSAFIGLEITGLYSNYLMIYNVFKKISKKFIRSSQASVGNLFAGSTVETRIKYFNELFLGVAIFCGLICVCVANLTDEFITIWLGHDFLIPYPFTLLVALELYILVIRQILAQMREVLGLFKQVKWRPLIEVIMNVFLSIFLVQKIGIFGVIIATIASEVITVLPYDPVMLYKFGFGNAKSAWRFYIKLGIYTAELGVSYLISRYICMNWICGYGWLSWIVHGILCTLITGSIMIGLNYRTDEFKNLWGIAMKMFKRKTSCKEGK